MEKKRVIYVVCEGDTESNYLQWLGRFFKENEIPLIIKPYAAESGFIQKIRTTYKKAYKDSLVDRSKPQIVIWVDKDIYVRNDNKCGDLYRQKKNLPDFLFSYMNFEDFLVLHNDLLLEKWTNICKKENHFSIPLKSKVHSKLFEEYIFKDYKKGILPDLFCCIDENEAIDLIRSLFFNNRNNSNSKNNRIHCDFLDYLEKTLKEIESTQKSDFIKNILKYK